MGHPAGGLLSLLPSSRYKRRALGVLALAGAAAYAYNQQQAATRRAAAKR